MPDNNINSEETSFNNSEDKENNSKEIKSDNISDNLDNEKAPISSSIPEKSIEDNSENVKEEEKKVTFTPTHKPLTKSVASNYQISLIDENQLKVTVTTKQGVKINSSVKAKGTPVETQTSEIYLYPKLDYSMQEIEVMITIEEYSKQQDESKKEEFPTTNAEEKKPFEEDSSSKGNYQINLINENLLNVKIITEKGVKIYSIARDKKTLIESQTNKIHLHSKSEGELQEVEIKIVINTEKKDFKDEIIGTTREGHIKLIPNPEVVDLIQPPDYSSLTYRDETISDSSVFKNPFDTLRKIIRRNLTIGIITAVALHIVAASIFFYGESKKSNTPNSEEQSRLIVIQDLPDPKIKLEDIEDPNKPKEEAQPETKDLTKLEPPEVKKEFPKKNVKPPRVIRPFEKKESDTTLENDLTRELDSLRRLVENKNIDTTKIDTSKATAYDIPDSLRNSFNENDIGLAMYFPKNWKVTDQREINKNEKEFKGILLTDTTAEQSGTMTMFIYLDPENKDFNAEDFKTEFKMNDSTLSAFSKEPKTLAGFTEYRFYIFNMLGTEKLSLRASVRKQFFDQYKNEIEAVVRSIRIRKKDQL